MLTQEERALAEDYRNRLLALYVEREEAQAQADWRLLQQLRSEIDDLKVQLEEIRRWDTVGTV